MLVSMSKDDEFRLWRFEIALRNAVYNRKLFTTSNSYMGLGLDVVREGDLIAFFLGAQVPFFIRQVEPDVYILVSECYVHGIMDGEAMQDTVNWKTSLQDIVLR
jgi:hypothetical protein